MIAAILAVVGAIVGVVGGVINANNAKFLQRSAEMEAKVQFERDKDLSLYGMYSSQAATRNVVIIAGVAFLLGITYLLMKNK